MRQIHLTRTAAWIMAILTGALAAQAATITVRVDRPGAKISPMLYGIFFEEINRAGEGGLYAEMIQNGSLEDDRGGNEAIPKRAPGWTPIKPAGRRP